MFDPVALLAEIMSAELEAGGSPTVCIFLGAGASMSSGGETFSELKKRLISQLTLESEDGELGADTINTSRDVEELFENLFQAVHSPHTRAKILKSAFPDRLLPSDGYVCVALLCAAGAVKSIITTNFDHYLESAVKKLGADENTHIVYAGSKYNRSTIQAISDKKTVIYKVHGDREFGIYNITDEELNFDAYPPEVQEVVNELINTNRIIISGYSGSEKRMSSLFNEDSSKSNTEIFWISPSPIEEDKPLFLAIKDRIIQLEQSSSSMQFDSAMKRLLSRLDSSFFDNQTSFFRSHSLYAASINQHTLNTLNVQDYLSLSNPLYVHREKILATILHAVSTDKLIAIIGPSGYGKSTLLPALIAELEQKENEQHATVLLSVGGDLRANTSLEDHLAKVLGLSQLLFPSLVLMNSDLKMQGKRLVIIIDAIDQARASIDEIKLLFRDIATFHAKCQADSIDRVKLVISCRSEIWQSMLSPTNRYRIDISGTQEIHVGPYESDEVETAFKAYATHHRITGCLSEVNPTSRSMMQEPILLRIICKAYERGELPETLELHHVFDNFIQSCFSGLRDYNALAFLEALAIKWLDPRIARDGVTFGDLPSGEDTLGENIDIALRAGIIRCSHQGKVESYTFFHERVLELFMVRYLLRTYEGPLKNIRFSHSDLLEGLEHAIDSKHAHNVFKIFLTNPRSIRALGSCISEVNDRTEAFLSECIIESSQVNQEGYTNQFISWFRSSKRPKIKSVLIQAAANSPQANSRLWEVLNNLEEDEIDLFITTSYYLLNTLATQLEENAAKLLSYETLESLLHHTSGQEMRSIGFILYLLARCAPERMKEGNCEALYSASRSLLLQLAVKMDIPSEEVLQGVAEKFSPRYMFNGSVELFQQFFKKNNNQRKALVSIIQSLTAENTYLSSETITNILSFADESQSWLEKILMQPLLIFLANKNIKQYCEVIKNMLKLSKTASHADFCSGSVAYQVAANDFFEDNFSYLVNSYCIDKRGDFLAQENSYSELFNPIGTYGFTFPRFHSGEPIDLFSYALRKFKGEKNNQLLCRVLHALRQTLALYPKEGLATLEIIVEYEDKLVRKRLVALLAEGYLVEPSLVSRFVWRHEKSFNEEERKNIFRSNKEKIHLHPITILEWGRVYRFFLWLGKKKWMDVLFDISQARSFTNILQAFLTLVDEAQTKKPSKNK